MLPVDPNHKRVLIGFGESLAAPEAFWSLRQAGFNVSAFVREGVKSAITKCRDVEILEICSPEEDARQTISDLENLVDSGMYDVVMPLDDVSLWLCSKIENDVFVPIAGVNGSQVDLALDKRLQVHAANQVGLFVPETRIIETVAEALELDGFPIILKPAKAIDYHLKKIRKGKFGICANSDELRSFVEVWNGQNPVIVQPLISGTGEGVFGFADSNGVSAWSAHQRVRMVNPAGSGSSACLSIPVEESLRESIERMITNANWRGKFMVELLRDDSGKAWFMEINGRPWGSMALARRMGFEYPAWSVYQAFDQDYIPPKTKASMPIRCRHLGREILHVLAVFRGPKSRAIKDWPSRWKTIKDVMHIRRNDKWYNMQPGYFKVFLYDAYHTVRSAILRRRK